jgi:zinc protease
MRTLKQFGWIGFLFFMLMGSVYAQPIMAIKKLKTSMPVYFVRAPQLPMIDIRLAFAAGSAYDGQRFGLSQLTTSLLDQGAGDLNANEIVDAFAETGALFDAEASRDEVTLSLRSLTDPKRLKPALHLFHQVLTQASFPKRAFMREQKQQLRGLLAAEQSPGTVAIHHLFQAVYGKHPYAHPVLGTTDTVRSINRANVIKFYKQYFVANNAVMVIVGDMSEAQATKVANQIIDGLPTGKAAPPVPPVTPLLSAKHVHVPFKATQTNIRIGQAGLRFQDKDYFPLLLGNYILGGMMTSRLFEEVRDKHGYAYAVYSYFQPLEKRGPFVISLGTKNAQAAAARQLSEKVLANYIKQGPTTAEMNAAKKFIIGSFPLRFDSNADIANRVLVLAFYHLPMDFYDHYVGKIEAITKEQVTSAFQRRIHPKTMAVISVGTRKGDGSKTAQK